MFANPVQSYFNKLDRYQELGRKPKDTLVRTSTREAAEIVAENIVSEIANRGHVQTGKLVDSISIVKEGPRSFDVKGVDYAKYVNGYGQESDGTGFIDDAVDNAIADGYSGIRQKV
jgi:hypothetical protein